MGKIKIRTSDKLFSQWIRLRDRMCKRCKSPVRFNEAGMPISHECSHFQGRGKEATRFEPLNCDTLCYGCHQYFTAFPSEHRAWQIEQKGEEVVDAIVLQSNQYKKRNDKEEAKYWREQIALIGG
jgi:hypothetical protein